MRYPDNIILARSAGRDFEFGDCDVAIVGVWGCCDEMETVRCALGDASSESDEVTFCCMYDGLGGDGVIAIGYGLGVGCILEPGMGIGLVMDIWVEVAMRV